MGEQKRPFSEEEIRSFMSQVLQGLAHMHKHGYFHRDLKPGMKLISGKINASVHSMIWNFMCIFMKNCVYFI